MATYTAADFEWATNELGNYLRPREADSKHRREAEIVLAALKTAVLVMKPGVLEMACGLLAGLPPEEVDEDQWRLEAGVIRKALTETTDV
jgi:hypothetical protein